MIATLKVYFPVARRYSNRRLDGSSSPLHLARDRGEIGREARKKHNIAWLIVKLFCGNKCVQWVCVRCKTNCRAIFNFFDNVVRGDTRKLVGDFRVKMNLQADVYHSFEKKCERTKIANFLDVEEHESFFRTT